MSEAGNREKLTNSLQTPENNCLQVAYHQINYIYLYIRNSKLILLPLILFVIVLILGGFFYVQNRNYQDQLQANKLLTNSQNEYNQIVDLEYAEVQQLPALNEIPHEVVNQGQVFVPILMYHHIRINPKPSDPLWASLNVDPKLLDSELNYLSKNNYHVITLNDLYNFLKNGKGLPTNPIILTFDDGYSDFFDNAFPILKKFNMKAIEFVITHVETYPAYLSWDQIKELDASGLIEIGDHTMTHPDLTALSTYYINQQIGGSKAELESHLGKSVNWFAYPYGAYNNYVVNEVTKAGYLGAVSTNYGGIQDLNSIYLLKRIMADGRFTLDEFARRVQNK